jgi:hypothetical protein
VLNVSESTVRDGCFALSPKASGSTTTMARVECDSNPKLARAPPVCGCRPQWCKHSLGNRPRRHHNRRTVPLNSQVPLRGGVIR